MKVLGTYIYREGECFLVSTIRRQSSAAIIPAPWYLETLAWEYDPINNTRGKIVAQAAESPALAQHMDVVKQLLETGEYRNAEDSECG